MVARGLRFGSVAAAYERYRPGYPDELVSLVLDYAGRPVRSALEIGAGTGKATRAFAARGIRVTATEPDREMLLELGRHSLAGVTPVLGAFESLALEPEYDLIYAAAALHWTSQTDRWARIASGLDVGGVFASFGGPVGLADPALDDAVAAARSRWLGDDGVPSPDGTPAGALLEWPGTELLASPWFTDVRQEVVVRRPVLSAEEYVGYLSTVSAYLQLEETDRADALASILDVLPARVEVEADLTVHLARLV